MTNGSESSLGSEEKKKQDQDPISLDLKANFNKRIILDFEQGEDGVLKYQGRLCVPRVDVLQGRIMKKAHSSRYSVHLHSTKMYRDLREVYWWEGMNKDIAKFCFQMPKLPASESRIPKARRVGSGYRISVMEVRDD